MTFLTHTMLAAIACGAMSLLVISISSVLNSSQMIGKFSLCDLCVLCASVVDSLTVCSNREQNRKHRGRTIAALQNIVALELESIGGGDEETVRHLRPLKRFPQTDSLTYSELKLGVNERDFARRCSACRSYPKLVHLRDSGELLTWHDGRAGASLDSSKESLDLCRSATLPNCMIPSELIAAISQLHDYVR